MRAAVSGWWVAHALGVFTFVLLLSSGVVLSVWFSDSLMLSCRYVIWLPLRDI